MRGGLAIFADMRGRLNKFSFIRLVRVVCYVVRVNPHNVPNELFGSGANGLSTLEGREGATAVFVDVLRCPVP